MVPRFAGRAVRAQAPAGCIGCGSVFQMNAKGQINLLHSFDYTMDDGIYPAAPLIQASDGSFYGTVPHGGANYDCGTCSRLYPAAGLGSCTSLSVAQTALNRGQAWLKLLMGTSMVLQPVVEPVVLGRAQRWLAD